MPISMKCPQCDALGQYPEADAGRTVECESCGADMVLTEKTRLVAQAKPVAAKPVIVTAKPIGNPPASKAEFEFDEEEEPKPRKKSTPIVEYDEDEDEPKPRKNSKPHVDLQEDDDSPRPSKKKRPRDDDEDDDRPRRKGLPPKKGGNGKILLILGGIAFVLFAGCTGVGIYAYLQAEKTAKSFASAPFPVDADIRATKPSGELPGPDVKSNVAKLSKGDNYETTVSKKMGLGGDAAIADLETWIRDFQDPNGSDKDLLKIVLDYFAPWVDKGFAKIYHAADFKYHAILVFSDPKFTRDADPKLKAVITLDQTDLKRSIFRETITLPREFDNDVDYKKFGLKAYSALKPAPVVTPNPNPNSSPKPMEVVKITAEELATEVNQDRPAAQKKYANATLQVTGEISSRSVSGAIIVLKGGLDENTMKAMIVPVTMKTEEREAAKKLQVGDKVTVTATLTPLNGTTVTAVPLKDGVITK